MNQISHRGELQRIAEDYRLKQQFVEALAPTEDERRKSTLLHALAGKVPEKTGRTLCRFCDCRLSDPACDNFRKSTVREVERILDEYLAAYCPSCKEKMEDFRPVEIAVEEEPTAMVSMEPEAPTDPMTFETETKTKVLPCECLLDEPKKLGAVDRDALDEAAQNGELSWEYRGKATSGMDPLEEFDV
jgi:hypothetical protein